MPPSPQPSPPQAGEREPSIARRERGSVHVVAGVITDAVGRILLTQRPSHGDFPELWEFPGGKVEPGESAEVALARELREELGIDARVGERLIAVPQAMPHKHIVLDVYRVQTFDGVPRGVDGQGLAWVALQRLQEWPMPPADIPVVAALRDADRYLVTPTPQSDDADWLERLQGALASGIQLVQLRARGCEAARWERLVAQAVTRCRAAGARVLVNGDVALALRHGIGLQLRASQLHAALAGDLTRIREEGGLLGASCHDADELARAQQLRCDFAVLGSVQPTTTHPGAPVLGWDGFAALRAGSSLPIYAIGGLSAGDVPIARAHGAQGIAAISRLWPAR